VIRDAGDSALVFELEPRIDPEVNARAIAIADAVRRAAIAGVRDVVSTYRSVAVFFDPLQTRLEAVTKALEQAASHAPIASHPKIVEVPVVYGGEHGPDLPDVARHSGFAEEEVVRIHAGPLYRVFMLGFVPGFAYMGVVDQSIAAPRRATPRARVPAGSVAIAGRQTGIYPQDSPGGWQLIGRTRVKPFDANRTPAFLVAAGDQVRFNPVKSIEETGGAASPGDHVGEPREDGGLTVIKAGLLTTIQDLGRWGSQDRGVPVAGPMDVLSHRIANAVIRNPRDAATIEITLFGLELRFEQDATFAVAGADLQASIAGRPVARNVPVRARAGETLRFGGVPRSDQASAQGARAYLAIEGGITTPPILGSRATHVLSAMGGLHGRPLAAGDRIPLGPASVRKSQGPFPPLQRRLDGSWASLPAEVRSAAAGVGPSQPAQLRVLPGPQDDFFDAAAFERLQTTTFTISPQSNRMAYRLTGGTVPRLPDREMISDATFFGGIQVPPSGEPILLMADRQTSGGYPQIATVITADLPLAGQLAPGNTIEFHVCTRREAIAALIAQEGPLIGAG
jgi:KipI family sensor histidine kinase inhibitor